MNFSEKESVFLPAEVAAVNKTVTIILILHPYYRTIHSMEIPYTVLGYYGRIGWHYSVLSRLFNMPACGGYRYADKYFCQGDTASGSQSSRLQEKDSAFSIMWYKIP